MSAVDSRAWPPGPAAPELAPHTIDVWRVVLPRTAQPDAASILTPAERRRASAFRDPVDATQFQATRATLRRLLGAYTGADPASLRLGTAAHGKPYLLDDGRPAQLQFSVAHTVGLALIAVGTRAVGVDVEAAAAAFDDRIAQRVFSASELASLQVDRTNDRLALWRLWTRKEAVLKGLGVGFDLPARALSVEDERVVAPPAAAQWTVRDLHPAEDHAAAVAAANDDWTLRQWSW